VASARLAASQPQAASLKTLLSRISTSRMLRPASTNPFAVRTTTETMRTPGRGCQVTRSWLWDRTYSRTPRGGVGVAPSRIAEDAIGWAALSYTITKAPGWPRCPLYDRAECAPIFAGVQLLCSIFSRPRTRSCPATRSSRKTSRMAQAQVAALPARGWFASQRA